MTTVILLDVSDIRVMKLGRHFEIRTKQNLNINFDYIAMQSFLDQYYSLTSERTSEPDREEKPKQKD